MASCGTTRADHVMAGTIRPARRGSRPSMTRWRGTSTSDDRTTPAWPVLRSGQSSPRSRDRQAAGGGTAVPRPRSAIVSARMSATVPTPRMSARAVRRPPRESTRWRTRTASRPADSRPSTPPSYRAPDDATESPAAARPAGAVTRERREEGGTGQGTDGERKWSRAGVGSRGDRLPRQPASGREAVRSCPGRGPRRRACGARRDDPLHPLDARNCSAGLMTTPVLINPGNVEGLPKTENVAPRTAPSPGG